MTVIRKFLADVALQRRWWWVLLGVNLFGSLYGFWWYKNQLLATPIWQWPIVPDSPGSTFLLTIWLGLLLAGVDWRRPGMQWLGAFAFVSNMKYGLWAATVLPRAGMLYGWEFDFIHLPLSHAAMWVQGLLFARYYKPAPGPALGALGLMWFQDLIDYRVLMTYPWLPHPDLLPFARADALLLSTLWGGFLVAQAWFDRRRSVA